MPIQFPDFLQAKPTSSSIADLVPTMMEGYKLGQMPQRMALEKQKEMLANALLSEKGIRANILNQYLPQREQLGVQGLGLDNQQKSILNRFLPSSEQARISGMQLENVGKNLQNQWYPSRQNAEIDLIKAQAEIAGIPPEMYLDLLETGGKHTPEFKKRAAGRTGNVAEAVEGPSTGFTPQGQGPSTSGLPQGNAGAQPSRVPEGRRAFTTFPVQERQQILGNMKQEAQRAESSIDQSRKIFKALDIVKQNPSLANDFFIQWASVDDPRTLSKLANKLFSNKNQVKEFETLNKLLSDLVQQRAESSGQTVTDYKTKLYEDAMGKAGMQGGAIEYVLKNNLEQNVPYLTGYGDLVKDGIKNGYAVESFEAGNYRLKPGQTMDDVLTVKNTETGQLEKMTRLEWFRKKTLG
jgi:hypothetical protein